MPWSIFFETVRRNLRGTLLWGGAFALLAFTVAAFLPDQAGMQDMLAAFESLPPFLFQMLGVDDITVLLTPAGFIGFRYFLVAAVLIAVWAVLSGLNVITNDEAQGITDVMLGLPVPRWRLLVERVLAYIPPAVVIPQMGVVGLMIAMAANPNARTDLLPMAEASLMLTPVALIVLSLTVFVGALLPRRGLVSGVATAFIAVSFVLKSVAGIARTDFADSLAEFSIFQQADAVSVISTGFPVVTALVMLGIAAALVGVSIGLFQRRDVAS